LQTLDLGDRLLQFPHPCSEALLQLHDLAADLETGAQLLAVEGLGDVIVGPA
jgi:hypothetical protein